ncbi:MAG: hypothetical protein JXR91_06705 [Deltaproteobacteria bacterium]|nr:hypothetical protein [Deltaproteobacteria bacterium]
MKKLKIVIACDSDDIIKSKGHFGDADLYQFFDLTIDGAILNKSMPKLEINQEKHIKGGDPLKAGAMKSFLAGNDVLVARQFGQNMKRMLDDFVCIIIRKDSVDEALEILKNNFNSILEHKNKETRKHLLLG